MIYRIMLCAGYLLCSIFCEGSTRIHKRSEPSFVVVIKPDIKTYFGNTLSPVNIAPALLQYIHGYNAENNEMHIPNISRETGLFLAKHLHTLHRFTFECQDTKKDLEEELMRDIVNLEHGEVIQAYIAAVQLEIKQLEQQLQNEFKRRGNVQTSMIRVAIGDDGPIPMRLLWSELLKECPIEDNRINLTAVPNAIASLFPVLLDYTYEAMIQPAQTDPKLLNKLQVYLEKLDNDKLILILATACRYKINILPFHVKKVLSGRRCRPETISADNVAALPNDFRNDFLKKVLLAEFELKDCLIETGVARDALYKIEGDLLVASGFYDDSVCIFNMRDRTTKFLTGPTDTITAVCLSSDRKTVSAGSTDGTVSIWNIETGELQKVLRHSHPVQTACILPDGKTLIAGYSDGLLVIWNLQTAPKILFPHTLSASTMSASAQGSTITWEMHPSCAQSITSRAGIVDAAVAASLIVTGTQEGAVRMWSTQGNLKAVCHHGEKPEVVAVSVLADGETVMAVFKDEVVLSIHVPSKVLHVVQIDSERLHSYTLPTDDSPTIPQWVLLKTPRDRHDTTDLVSAACISSDGSTIALGYRDGSVKIITMNTSSCVLAQGHKDSINALGLSSDNTSIISASDDGSIRIWNRQGNLLATCLYDDPVESILITNDDKIIARCEDGSLSLLDIKKNIQWSSEMDSILSLVDSAAHPDFARRIWQLLRNLQQQEISEEDFFNSLRTN